MTMWKNGNKKARLCMMIVTACLVLAAVWAVLATPETALAKKPGDSGNAPVCITFDEISYPHSGIQSDGGPYCDDKQLKVEAIMTPDGHVNLQPNTGRGGGRTLYVDVHIGSDTSGLKMPTEGWRFIVGGWNENFDMRTMGIGASRDDVNLQINTIVPDNVPDNFKGENWRLIFDPSYNRWDTDCSDSTYVTVVRTSEYTWDVIIDDTDQAVLILQAKVKNKSTFETRGVVTVPPFKATITLNK